MPDPVRLAALAAALPFTVKPNRYLGVEAIAKRGCARSLTHTGAAVAHAKGGALLQRGNVCGRVCMYLSRVSTL